MLYFGAVFLQDVGEKMCEVCCINSFTMYKQKYDLLRFRPYLKPQICEKLALSESELHLFCDNPEPLLFS